MLIASWNVNSLRVRLQQVLDWLERNPVDLLALQETKLCDEEFPFEALRAAGYEAVANGQPAYNGIALLSRQAPAADVLRDLPGGDDPQRRLLAATYEGVRIIGVYVPNGQSLGSDKYAYKLDWLARLRDFAADELRRHQRLILLGDWNIAPEDRDVHDPQRWEGHLHVSPAERAALGGLLGLGLADSFRLFDQPPGSFSWWDYRAGAWRRNRGLRIDLVLVSLVMAERCRASRIDREPRGWPRPSDHAPVLAEFDI